MDYLTYRWTNTYISVDLAHHEIFRAKVGKGGIICHIADILILIGSLARLKSN